MKRKLNIKYLAGFFDGEGCINLQARKGGRKLDVRIIVTNTNRKILEEYKNRFGGGLVTTKYRTKNDNGKKVCYQWIAWNRHAEKFLKEIVIYLTLKQKKAKKALKVLSTVGYYGRVVPPNILRKRLKLCKN